MIWYEHLHRSLLVDGSMRSRCVIESNRLREDLSNFIYGLVLEVVEPVVLDDSVKSLSHSVVKRVACLGDAGYDA